VLRETSISVSPANTINRGHQFMINWANEKATLPRAKIIRPAPNRINVTDGTMYFALNALYRCQPAGKRASPEKIDKSGHNCENLSGMIPSAKRRRNKPDWRKSAAKKRYSERRFSFIAKTARAIPRITSINEIKTGALGFSIEELNKKAVPRNMRKKPIIKINRAAGRRVTNNRIL